MPAKRSQANVISRSTNAVVEVDVYDDNTFITRVPVNSDGSWSVLLPPLGLGRHSLTGRVGQLTSPARTFTVEPPIPPLVLDESPAILQTTLYMLTRDNLQPVLPTFPSGSTVTRTAAGGSPPYSYRSSNAAVANVTSSGLVSPRANGVATITVQDGAGQSKSYSVTVRNVWTAEYIGRPIHRGAVEYQRPGGHLPTRAEMGVMGNQYQGRWPTVANSGMNIPNDWYWTDEYSGGNALGRYYWRKQPVTGGEDTFLEHSAFEAFSVYPRNA